MGHQELMAILKIIYPNDCRLRQPAETVTVFDNALKQLADNMLETMQNRNGVGLAGPQVGVMRRICVIEIPTFRNGDDQPPHPQSGQSYVLVNPEIVRSAKNKSESEEGCLSVPTWYGCVERSDWVEVTAHDLEGKLFKLKVDDLLSRAFQHEIDHLDGVLFTDRITAPEKLWQNLPDDK